MNEELEKIKEIFSMMLEPGSDCTWKNPPQPMEIEELLELSFQAGRASAVSEIRDKMPKKKSLLPEDTKTNVGYWENKAFNQYSDEMDKILEGMEKK